MPFEFHVDFFFFNGSLTFKTFLINCVASYNKFVVSHHPLDRNIFIFHLGIVRDFETEQKFSYFQWYLQFK